MQQRRARQQQDRLPLTENDLPLSHAKTATTTSRRTRPVRRRRKQLGGNGGLIIGCSVAVVVFVSAILLFAKATSTVTGTQRGGISGNEPQLPLSEFKSLRYAFSHSRLVGLYFAAAWCPMSTPVTEGIEQYLGPKLLPASSNSHPVPMDRALMSLVYVSSDHDEEAFREYQGENWQAVPFHSVERNKIKQYFRICAKPEIELLQIDRKGEIPSLLILDGETHALITASGAEDIEEYEENVLDHWLDLQNLMTAMAGKYGGGEEEAVRQPRRFHHQADSISSLFA